MVEWDFGCVIVFVFWFGEELGFIGLMVFVNESLFEVDELVVYFNFDMVGWMCDNWFML